MDKVIAALAAGDIDALLDFHRGLYGPHLMLRGRGSKSPGSSSISAAPGSESERTAATRGRGPF